jgi:UDP-N-acetylglucosamine--N-acetylmuramyl-(pentapeptide) pyrophosphoryl-undecaprenol N-acetylglucosamine transferase
MSAAINTDGLRVLIGAGGTGGHVFPGIAVAEEVRAQGGTPLFVGTFTGLEARAVPRAGFRIATIEAGKLKRVGWRARLSAFGLAPYALMRCIRIVRTFRPHVTVGAGGYVSAPVVTAARMLGVPTLLLEQNSVPGVTNRWLARLAQAVVIAFAEAEQYFTNTPVVPFGNPIRRELVARLWRNGCKEQDAAETKAANRKVTGANSVLQMLVLGGSQGARALNDTMVKAAPMLAKRPLYIIHQTGAADRDWVAAAYRRWGVQAQLKPFFDDMAEVYTQSDVVLCRAGATTIAELTLAGLPALLVPFPHAADDHQQRNALAVERGGGGRCIAQRQLTAPRLLAEIDDWMAQPDTLREMQTAMHKMARPQAAADVVGLAAKLAQGGGR